jgi:hypothetical protein
LFKFIIIDKLKHVIIDTKVEMKSIYMLLILIKKI